MRVPRLLLQKVMMSSNCTSCGAPSSKFFVVIEFAEKPTCACARNPCQSVRGGTLESPMRMKSGTRALIYEAFCTPCQCGLLGSAVISSGLGYDFSGGRGGGALHHKEGSKKAF